MGARPQRGADSRRSAAGPAGSFLSQPQGLVVAKTCECGCGQPAPLAKKSNSQYGHVKGQPVRFIRGHHLRLLIPEKQTCTVGGCGNQQYGRGWCSKHYARWRRTGSPVVIRGNPTAALSIRDRLAERLDKSAPGGCWLWTGGLTDHGYGTIRYLGRTRYVHRLMYEVERGPIPEGMQLDHLCRNRSCANPAHIEPVTSAENTRRGASASYLRGRCRNGHVLTDVGLYVSPKGRRMCRGCIRKRQGRAR